MYGSNSQKKRQKKRTKPSGNRTHALLNISVGAYH